MTLHPGEKKEIAEVNLSELIALMHGAVLDQNEDMVLELMPPIVIMAYKAGVNVEKLMAMLEEQGLGSDADLELQLKKQFAVVEKHLPR